MSHRNRPGNNPNQNSGVTLREFRGEVFAGPLPPPSQLEAYERIHRGAADRIIRMAEDQSAHRRGLETGAFNTQAKLSLRGQVAAVVLAFVTVAASVYCASIGQTLVATTLGGSTLVSLATLFFRAFSTAKQKEEKEVTSVAKPQ